MKLTTFTDFSLRVLMFLAAEPERRATIGRISTARGKGGGVTLARSADQVIVGRVVRDTEGVATTAECFDPPPVAKAP